jgi:hypothetical protein
MSECLGSEFGSCARLVGWGTARHSIGPFGATDGTNEITERQTEVVGVEVKGYSAVLGVWGEGSTECGQKVRRCDVDGGASGGRGNEAD